jgi:hypothetical protein
MIKASLVGPGLEKNRIFSLTDPSNRDNCFEPYVRLRETFLEHGSELNTADVNAGQPVTY